MRKSNLEQLKNGKHKIWGTEWAQFGPGPMGVPLSTKGIRQFCLNQLSTSPMRPLRLKFFFELNVSPAWSKLALTAFTTQAREKEIALQKEWVKILQHQNPLDCYPVIFVLTWINLYCISRSKPVVHLSNRLFGNQLDLHRDPQHNGCQVVLARWRHREDNSTGMQGMTWQLPKMATWCASENGKSFWPGIYTRKHELCGHFLVSLESLIYAFSES